MLAALVRTPEEEQAVADEQAVARVAAAKAATIAPQAHVQPQAGKPPVAVPVASVAPVAPRRRARIETTPDEDDPRNDPTAEDGRFA